jgi:protein tyrosine/serine phosphatase
MKPLVVMLLFLGALPAPSQVVAAGDDSVRELTAVGAKLKHFAPVDVGVYKGSRPKSDADYRFLQSLRVKYIVDLQAFPFMSFLEKRKARKYGITVIPGIMNASPISPSEKHIGAILAILRDEKYHPIYFHCRFGRDRTNVIAALYRMYFLGMSPQDATQYLHESGYAFRFGWLRSGLTRYVRNHPTPPPDLLSASETR